MDSLARRASEVSSRRVKIRSFPPLKLSRASDYIKAKRLTANYYFTWLRPLALGDPPGELTVNKKESLICTANSSFRVVKSKKSFGKKSHGIGGLRWGKLSRLDYVNLPYSLAYLIEALSRAKGTYSRQRRADSQDLALTLLLAFEIPLTPFLSNHNFFETDETEEDIESKHGKGKATSFSVTGWAHHPSPAFQEAIYGIVFQNDIEIDICYNKMEMLNRVECIILLLVECIWYR
ncbi:neurogenic locus notch homolog protein 2 [Striga asiatica]|uniref:Neurogenic locus notch homolog protein 2 n=1 Tax=Striga asiatica TaxID=4170 RepID=A0A5A7Q2D2_STRAF|nr:neurogenic locus notch homolog protein 2 [Striga asiatica]